jgi:PAS domain S-box-containing protein
MLEHMDEGVIRVKEGCILSWNRGAERIYNYPEAEMLGKDILMLIDPGSQHKIRHIFERLHYEDVVSLEMKHLGKEGQEVYAWVTFIANRDGGKDPESITMLTRNITAQKKIDERLIRLEELSQFGQMAASISHEIRNPLSVVKGFLQMFSGKMELEKYTEHMEMILSEIDRVDSMISEFLVSGRLNHGVMLQQNLNEILRALLPLLQADALERGKILRVELQKTPELKLNKKEIRQVILNLVRNSLEATLAGGTVLIKTYCEEDKVVLAVQDQGEGIDPQILGKLGTPFLTTKETGTGLGLPVCYRIAEKHQAEIDVHTSAQGTTFYVKFPTEAEISTSPS